MLWVAGGDRSAVSAATHASFLHRVAAQLSSSHPAASVSSLKDGAHSGGARRRHLPTRGCLARAAPAELDSMAALQPPGTGWAAAEVQGNEQTHHALDVPPTVRLGPRVEHLNVPRDGSLAEILSEALALPQEYVRGLIDFGAVHYSTIHPLPPQKIARDSPDGQRQLEAAQAARLAGRARHGKNPKLSVPRRVTGDIAVHQYGYCRVHVHPRRFPLAYAVDWRERIIAETDDFVVLNKPPGVQVTPTVDNCLESCLILGAKAIGREEPLHITHRLDTCTEGVLITAKTKDFVQRFNASLLVPGALQKTYRAVTKTPVSTGLLVDYVVIKQRQKGGAAHTVVLESERLGSLRCELDITSVEQVALTGAAATRWGATAYEHTIELLTGRTHQIRAQLAAAGAPLLGDHLYGADEAAPPDVPIHGEAPAAVQGKRDVIEPIGLQAYRLRVSAEVDFMGAPPVCFTAPDPWWRS